MTSVETKDLNPIVFSLLQNTYEELVYELTAPYYMAEISLHGDSLHQK